MIAFTPSDINLASQPFRKERAQNAGLALAGVVLLCSLIVLVSVFLQERSQAADLRRIIAGQQTELHSLQTLQAGFSSVLNKPANADVFSESVLLNELIAKRSVSWTRVFQDLGTVLPGNMRLLSIRLPQVAADKSGRNRVELDMWVGTEQPPALRTLLRRLETSTLFGDASVMSQLAPTQNDPLYKFRLTVAYAQQL